MVDWFDADKCQGTTAVIQTILSVPKKEWSGVLMFIIFPLSWLGIAFAIVWAITGLAGIAVSDFILSARGVMLFCACLVLVLVNFGLAFGMLPDSGGSDSSQRVGFLKRAQLTISEGGQKTKEVLNCIGAAAGSTVADLYLFLPLVALLLCYFSDYAEKSNDILWLFLGPIDAFLTICVVVVGFILLGIIWIVSSAPLAFSIGANRTTLIVGSIAIKLLAAFCVCAFITTLLPPVGVLEYQQVISGSLFEVIISSNPIIL